jgi:hypothetical protein
MWVVNRIPIFARTIVDELVREHDSSLRSECNCNYRGPQQASDEVGLWLFIVVF